MFEDEPGNNHHHNILIVDGDPDNFKDFTDVLKNQSYSVCVAADTDTALKIIEKDQPFLILLNVQLPTINGYEACKILKQHEAAKLIPVILFNVRNISKDKKKCFESGGIDYFTKPIVIEEVLARVNVHVINRKLQIDRESNTTLINTLQEKEKQNRRVLLNILSDQKRTLTSLEESLERFEFANNATFNIIWDWNIQSNALWWNSNLYVMFGYTPEEIEPDITSWTNRIHPDDLHRIETSINAAIHSDNQSWYDEYRFRKKSGTYAYVIDRGFISRDKNGKALRMIGAVEDITPRKQTEEALQESEQKFKNIVRYSPLGIYQSSVEGRFITINNALVSMLGYDSPDELMHLDIARDVYFDKKQREALIAHFAPGGAASDIEILWKKKDGSPLWIQLNSNAVKDQSGKVLYFEGFVRDINNHKHSEEALRESEQKYRQLVDGSPDSIVIYSEGKIVFANQSSIALMGAQSVNDLIGKSVIDFVHPAYREFVVKRMMETIKNGKALPIAEEKFIRLDGTDIDVEVKAIPVIYDKKHAIQVIVHDISERKRTNDKLIENEKLLRETQSIAKLGSYSFNITENRWKSSDVLDNIFGIDSTYDCSFEGWISIIHPDWQELMKNYFANDVVGKRSQFNKEYKIVRHDNGEERWVHGLGELIFNNENQPVSLIGTISDITERKHTELALRESEERFRSVTESANDAIILRDLNHTIIYWNKGAAQMYGWRVPEVIGKDMREVLYHDTKKYNALIEKVLKEGSLSGEFIHYTKDNTEIIVDVRLSVIKNTEGNPVSILSINSDITKKKKLEAQFLRAQRMEGLGTLAGGIAHDLNNVLAPIMLSVELLKKSYVNETSQKILESVESSSRRGSEIVKQILAFARGIETQKILMQPHRVVKEVVGIFKETFPRSITITSDIPISIWTVVGDPTHFHQMIMNLGVNARDAMPDGGTLSITASNEVIDEQYVQMNIDASIGRFVMFSVKDTGAGMTPQVLDHLFEPFFTTKELGKGTGLGLSTVYTIVKSHNGFIKVQSELGKGTTFNIFLPAADASPVSEKEQVLTKDFRGNGELILVVDDENPILNVTQHTLEANNYAVITASDGAEGVARYAERRNEIALVITDMMMPVMDGHLLIKAIRKMNPAIKIIASSGLIDTSRNEFGDENAVNGYIDKPYTAEKLMGLISSVIKEK